MHAPIWSEWMSWETFWNEGYKTTSMNNPGVYLLARFEDAPTGVANPEDARVVYVGETTSQVLSKRLYDFNRSAHEGKDGHSGGWTYRDLEKTGELPKGTLHVAVLAVPAESHPFIRFYIKHTERAAIWRYVERHGKPPLCNRD